MVIPADLRQYGPQASLRLSSSQSSSQSSSAQLSSAQSSSAQSSSAQSPHSQAASSHASDSQIQNEANRSLSKPSERADRAAQPLLTLIIPLHNEAKNILPLHAELTRVLSELRGEYDYEIIFVNDGSKDSTPEILDRLSAQDSRVHYIEFSRNFGKEIATSAGLHYARGHAAIMMDGDLQHPPHLIPEFVRRWRAGADVVVGVRENRSGEGLVKGIGSSLFYRIMNLVGETSMIPRSTDFRLLDRRVVSEFQRFGQHNRMTRALIDWLGFKRDLVYFKSGRRTEGAPGYTFHKLVRLATTSVISNSLLPLRLSGYLGLFIAFFSGCAGLYILLGKYVFNEPFAASFSGPAQLAILIVFLVGIILISLGILALYIANIHDEVMNRPMYIVRRQNVFREEGR